MPRDEAVPVQLLDERRHRRLVAGDGAAELGLGDAGIVVDDDHRGKAAGLQVRLAGMPGEGAEGGVLGEAKMEADEVVERAEADIAVPPGRGRLLARGRRAEVHTLMPPSTISMAPVVKLL